jgi:hypothetical protein
MAELMADHAGHPEHVAVLALGFRQFDRFLDVAEDAGADFVVRPDPNRARPGRVRQHRLEVVLRHERRPELLLAVVQHVGLLAAAGMEEDDAVVRTEVDRGIGREHRVANEVDDALLEIGVVAVVGHGTREREHRIPERGIQHRDSARRLLPELLLEEEKPVVVGGGGVDGGVAERDADREDVEDVLCGERRARRVTRDVGPRKPQAGRGKPLPRARASFARDGRHRLGAHGNRAGDEGRDGEREEEGVPDGAGSHS